MIVSFANPVVEVRPLSVTVNLATAHALTCNTSIAATTSAQGTQLHFTLPEGPLAAASAVFECTHADHSA
jgi:hypothetical protein